MTTNEAKHRNTNSTSSEYSSEDEAEADRICKCKDHYEILDVPKNATIFQINAAYKKLAPKLHPDRNKCPGAEEAFKKLGNAKETLIDPDKRSEYDKNLSPANNVPNSEDNFETDFEEDYFWEHFRAEFHRDDQWQDETNDIPQRTPDFAMGRNPNDFNIWKYIGITIVLFFIATRLVPSTPLYSLTKNPDFPVARRTQNLKIRYYVGYTFARKLKASLDKLEEKVEKEHMEELERACAKEKSYLFIRQMFSNIKSWVMSEEVEEIRTPTCSKLENFNNLIDNL